MGVASRSPSEAPTLRYSLPFGIISLNLALLVVLRSALHFAAARGNCPLPSGAFYLALWILPLVAIIHALLVSRARLADRL